MSFGFYEIVAGGRAKARAFPGEAFPSVEAAIAWLGDKVVASEIEPDGSAGDVFIQSGQVLAIEGIA